MGTHARPSSEEELLSLEEAADMLSVSKSTLYRMIDRRDVKGSKVGRQWRFSRADLRAYLDRGPQAVVLATVPATEVDALLPSLAEASERLDLPLPAIEPTAGGEAKLQAYVLHIVRLAITAAASDIHLMPARQHVVVKVRIDGVLHDLCRIPSAAYPAVMGQVKQLAEMNVDERTIPQDGRIHFRFDDRDYDCRINVLPTVFGESAVLRILDQSSVLIGVTRIGLTAEDQARLERWMQTPAGLVLATGPTGSGKTTTLYSCLTRIATPEKNTLTIEDPVEYQLPHTRQTSVSRRSGLTFAVALRAFLRQDPDVIMVGEMRDLETAEIVMQAALTGHLVLSTLMPSNPVAALTRLTDMGVEPFMVGSALIGVLSQRLVRKVCPHCCEPAAYAAELVEHVRELAAQGGYTLPADAQFYRGAGCDQCFRRGYRGRTGLFSLLDMTQPIRDALVRRAAQEDITRLAVAGGMRTFFADGIRKATEGLTTVDEVFRLTTTTG
ncbi:MAG TPA: ATPase, T2SS/T4P/T4SS family [Armatimonadota bacterium]|nr:ATPase, T2SS/T4P/T4SS family [Armatimonadota bacterium]